MQKHCDYVLLGVFIALILLGILILASVSPAVSLKKFGNTYYFFIHQIIYGLLPGLISFIIFFKIPLSTLKKISPIIFLINLVFLLLVFFPKVGLNYGGASRWVSIGPIIFQPSEFLKITFLIYFVSLLSSHIEKDAVLKLKNKNYTTTFIAFIVPLLIISLILVSQPDVSTLAIIFFITFVIYFLAQTPLWQNILIISFGFVGLLVLIKLATYRFHRLLVFLKPETDPLGIGYQIKQALIAIGSGGIFGLGLGMSRQKFGFLPQNLTDSIFAIFSEETGFIGSFVLIFLFLIFFWRGFNIAKNAKNKFAQLLALGISTLITIQAFINIGSMIAILPLTGIPLPFISYGGSHLIMEMSCVGILLNISKNS